jgi:hypothetical protein
VGGKDMDGYDCSMLERVLTGWKPKVVVIEVSECTASSAYYYLFICGVFFDPPSYQTSEGG